MRREGPKKYLSKGKVSHNKERHWLIIGTPPSDLPITSPDKSLLVLNLKNVRFIDMTNLPNEIAKAMKIYD